MYRYLQMHAYGASFSSCCMYYFSFCISHLVRNFSFLAHTCSRVHQMKSFVDSHRRAVSFLWKPVRVHGTWRGRSGGTHKFGSRLG